MMLPLSPRRGVLLSFLFLLLAATTIGAQQLAAPAKPDETTTKLVAEMIGRYHISQKPLDDKISQQLLTRFLKELDPQKLYLLQSDYQEFSKYRDHLDDYIKLGNTDFGRSVFDRFIVRLNERIDNAHKLIDSPQDFTVDEDLVVDPENTTWSTTAAELDERWRKRIKYDLLNLKLDDVADEEARKRLHKRYDTLRRAYSDMEPAEVQELYLSSMAHCFDPHSSYMSPQTLEDFQISMRLSLQGIGAALRSEDGYTVVAEVVPGGAAEKDGRLKVGDKITAVAQADGEFQDIVEMKLSKVVRLIRGDSGTKVTLRVQTADGKTETYDLTRQKIELKSSEVKGEIIPAPERLPGTTGRIGVINIPSFYRDFGGAQEGLDDFKSTARDVLKVLDDFKKQGGVDVLVIDLRGNGGGALSEAIEVSGLFIEDGPVVQVKEQNGRVKSHDDTEKGVAYSGPLVVLCNRLSASASEIFAAAIKDYHRGLVIGDTTTHGKGTVQNVMPVAANQMFRLAAPNRGALKLTINQFYRVNGDSTQNLGVPADVVLPSLIDNMDLGESFLDNALAFDKIDPAQHVVYDMVNPGLVSNLRETSQERVAKNEDFTKIKADIAKFLERKNRKSIPLNEEKLKSERAIDKAEEKVVDEEEKRETKKSDEPIFPKTAYNDEVLHISIDYANLLKSGRTAAR
jgi:carboxyl-terminal processing protease